MLKKILLFILSAFLWIGILIAIGYNLIYKQWFLNNDDNLFMWKQSESNLLNTWSFENFSWFMEEIEKNDMVYLEQTSSWDNGEISNDFYQDINFSNIKVNDNIKDVIEHIDQKPHNTNGYYFWIVYGIWSEDIYNNFTTDIVKLIVYNEFTKNLVTVTIPRDLVFEYDKEDIKMDFLYNKTLQESNSPIKAVTKVTNFISKEFQLPLNYYLLVNFWNFKEFIDNIWWINFCSEKPVYWFDEETNKKELIADKWCNHIDWDTALKISRTRKQDNDFYRSLRQTQLIRWMYEKIASMNYSDISRVFVDLIKKIHTNMNIWEMLYSLWRFEIKRNVNVVINADCNLWQAKTLKFCLLRNWWKRDEYRLRPIVDKQTINHYIHSIVLYPELFNCEFNWKWSFQDMLNLKNIWMKIKKFKFSKSFEIENLKWCNEESVNYFLQWNKEIKEKKDNDN